jgi:hypothetical protein
MNKVLIIFAFMAGIILGIAFLGVWNKASNSKSEYMTASVIRKVEEFYMKNNQWPKSWSDLGLPNQDEYVFVDFSLNVSNADRLDVFKAINTKSRRWLTYPYYLKDMESLATLIIKADKVAGQK